MASESGSEFLRCFVFVHGCTLLVDDDADFHKALTQVDFSPISKIIALKDFGNNLFRQNQFDFAADCFDKACRLLCYALSNKMDRDLQSFTTLAISLSLNLDACANKLHAFDGALIIYSMVLNFFPRNAKALFRTAVALRGLNILSEAKNALEKANLIEPHNRDVIEQLEEVRNSLIFNQSGQHKKNLCSSLRLQEVDVAVGSAADITGC
ncbi:uncharacterized protein LOC141619957 [Silene latifolia]|uniref:uncharacterized protein LOC141619957 n=1 Tax=Silene latifolia TaxID=37657 RepID=UPI003D787FBB